GGTGSMVAMQLAHLGVGKLIFVDGDRVERTNVSRIIGSGIEDAKNAASKVDVAVRYARNLNLPIVVKPIQEFLTQASLRELASCDVIFSCVDRHQPRALLNRLAYDLAIPVIDIG